MIVDAHQHVWQYDPAALGWIEPGMDLLMRDWLPADLAPALAEAGVAATIAVQACSDENDTEFLIAQANTHDWIAGVVGWVDLRAADAGARIDRWRDAGPLVGLRHQLEGEPALLEDPAFNAGVAEVQRRHLVYEVQVNAAQLADAVAFCARHDQHTLVIDHLAKPAIGAGEAAFEAWQGSMSALAAMPHVAVKCSGLATETRRRDDGHLATEAIRRHLDSAMALFGPDRLLFGSDWPVCRLATTYQDWFALIHEWLQGYDAATADAVLGGNAIALYGLPQTLDKA